MAEFGDRARCRYCSQEIVFNGDYWRHARGGRKNHRPLPIQPKPSSWNPLCIIENHFGHKVVWSPDGQPKGSDKKGNYAVLLEFEGDDSKEQALAAKRRLEGLTPPAKAYLG